MQAHVHARMCARTRAQIHTHKKTKIKGKKEKKRRDPWFWSAEAEGSPTMATCERAAQILQGTKAFISVNTMGQPPRTAVAME